MEIDRKILEASAQRYLMIANQFRADVPTEARFNFFRGPAVYPDEPGLLELHNAVVLTGEWFILAGGSAYCDAFVQSPFPPWEAYSVRRTPDDIAFIAEPPMELPTRQGFLLGGCANYCHWLMDYLPRLEFYRSDCGPLLMNGPIQPFQTQAFSYLGVKISDVIPLEYPRSYRVPKLFHPRTASALCTPNLRFKPSIVAWLRDKFKRLRSPGGGQRKLFVSRSGNLRTNPPRRLLNEVEINELASGTRRLLNDDEITNLARGQGFEIVRCEELPFEAQITMFSEASIIVGAHGAGLTNLIFAPTSAKIVEMIGPRFNREQLVSLIFMKLASILGQDFVRVVGKSDETVPLHMDHLPFETYTIEPAEFLAAIRS